MISKKERAAQLAARKYTASEIIDMTGVSRVWLDRMMGRGTYEEYGPDAEFIAYLHAYRGDELTEQDLQYIDVEDPKWHYITPEAEHSSLQDKYRRLEHKVVDGLYDAMAMAMDAKQLTAIVNTIASRQASMQKAAPLVQINNVDARGAKLQQVQLSLPDHALGHDALQLNSNNEVIAIEGRSLTSLTAHETSDIIEARRAERQGTSGISKEEFPDL